MERLIYEVFCCFRALFSPFCIWIGGLGVGVLLGWFGFSWRWWPDWPVICSAAGEEREFAGFVDLVPAYAVERETVFGRSVNEGAVILWVGEDFFC